MRKQHFQSTLLAVFVSLGCWACDTGVSGPDGMALVPEGPFWMGCNSAVEEYCVDGDDRSDLLYHKVTLDAYYIDRTEVTMAEFQACVDAGVCTHHLDDQKCYFMNFWLHPAEQMGLPPRFRGDDRPMVCVDWHQALQYCEWKGKRLPTEAEWEKAARGTDGRRYPWGNQVPACDSAVMSVMETPNCFPEVTSNVCSKSPAGDSPYGLCDMVGNVAEWVSDWLDWDYYNSSPVDNPTGPDSGSSKGHRGGCFFDDRGITVSYRLGHPPDEAWYFLGFRCVMPAESFQKL